MKVRDLYKEAMLGKHHSLMLMIEFLVYEKSAVRFEDNTEKLRYYLQDRFRKYMNKYLAEYEVNRREQERTVNSSNYAKHAG